MEWREEQTTRAVRTSRLIGAGSLFEVSVLSKIEQFRAISGAPNRIF
jgi:hypothetical protein